MANSSSDPTAKPAASEAGSARLARAALELPIAPPLHELAGAPSSGTIVGLDFDGTLTPIVSHYTLVSLRGDVFNAIQSAASQRRMLVCTGRAVNDVLKYVPDAASLDIIGNHGLEWKIWRKDRKGEWTATIEDRTPPGWHFWHDQFLRDLNREVEKHGGEVEDKHLSLTLHYRGATEWWLDGGGRAWLEARVQEPAKLLDGKACWNVLPIGASKGEAVARYLKELGAKRILFVGDEPTDETVFSRTDCEVIGVRVGEGETHAHYRLADVDAVHRWILDWAGR